MTETQQRELSPSFAQEQLWFIDNFHDGFPAHNVPHLVWLRGPLDVPALHRAVERVAVRHEALRTRLAPGPDGRPAQVIDPPSPVDLELTDYSALEAGAAREQLREFVVQEALHPFRLAAERLFRVRLVRLAADEHVLTFVAHRVVLDDWSFGVLFTELARLYACEVSGTPDGLAPPSVQFADFSGWERQRLAGPVLDGLEEYWADALAGLPVSRFPTDRPRPLLASHDGAVESITLEPELLAALRELAAGERGTLPEVILAAVAALLWRYTGQADVVVGLVSQNRDRPGLAEAVGLLANALPVRADMSADPPFRELLAQVREAAAGARAHQDLPFAKIVDVLRLERDPGRFPVFQIGLTCLDPIGDTAAAGVTFHHERAELRALQYDLSLVTEARAGRRGEELRIEATYPPALFDAVTITRLLGHLEVLLRGVAAHPSARLSQLPVLTGAELARELTEWNDTAREFPVTCIHEGFEERVRRDPAAVAAEFEGERWSYGELNSRANQVARRLRATGIGPETLVGVCLPVSLDRLAVLLGIWKAGGGYVPLDPGLPAERLAFLVSDTAMPAVVTDEASAAALPSGVTLVRLDAEHDEIRRLDDSDLPGPGARPSNVAYVIYTSGSTGEPKGVVVEHRQALNFLHGMAEHWRIGPGAAVLSFAAFTFDVSVMDMFMPLLGGARVVLAAPQTLHSPPRLAALIRDAGVTFACLPPAVLNLLTGEEFPGLRTLLSAGEELTSELLRAWLRQGQLEIYNGYGPTEASIGSTFMRMDVTTQLPPPIGRPKPNYQAYVLDAFLNPVPVGVVGELHIGGAGVARGYLNRPELTRERFIPDPFRPGPGARLYKTGDLVRRRPDGTIGFVGRADDQVKIRGLRVELGEIEASLSAHPAVAQAVVIMITDPAGDQQLAAYVRPAEGTAPQPGDLRAHLADRLPAYMVPGYLMILGEFPLTRHGKIDKAALPEPQAIGAGGERVPPATLIETVLVDMYAGVLGIEQAGATDSFFDVGGNSLQAMQLITQLRAALAVDLDIAAVFLAPAPRQLAALLRDKHGFEDEELGAGGIEDLAGTS